MIQFIGMIIYDYAKQYNYQLNECTSITTDTDTITNKDKITWDIHTALWNKDVLPSTISSIDFILTTPPKKRVNTAIKNFSLSATEQFLNNN